MRTIYRLVALLLLLGYFALGLDHVTHASMTFDEGPHLAIGYVTLRTGDFRLQPVHIHPPLANVLAAAPLLLQTDLPDPRAVDGWAIASLSALTDAIVWQYPHPARIATAGRLPILLIGVLLGALIYRWANDLGGRKAGLVALALFAFDPNMIAHGSLITTDMVATFLSVATLYVANSELQIASCELRMAKLVRLVIIGVLLGLAQLAKVSALMLVPVTGFLLLIYVYRSGRRASSIERRAPRFTFHVSRFILYVSIVFLTAALVVWAGYGFEIADVPGVPVKLPAATHVRIFQSLREHYDLGHPTFLQGRISDHGWWWYFPVAFALKTPLSALILALYTLFVVLIEIANCKLRITNLSLWLFPALYAVSSLFSTVNIGYRHLLPVLPFLYIGIGRAVASVVGGRDARAPLRLTFYVLFAWLVVGTLALAPDYLTFFNELAGGPVNGYRHLVDSNLDWGQNLWDLRAWMDASGEAHVYYAHYSPARPRVYGIDADFLPPDPRAVDFAPWHPAPGLYAIGATVLQGPYAPGTNTYAWFRAREPDAVLGHALFVYRVPSQPAPGWAVLCTGAGVSEQTVLQNLGVPALRFLQVDCATAQVYPSSSAPGLYVTRDAPLFVASRTMPLRADDGGVSAIVHFVDSAVPAPTNSVREVRLDGPLTFLGSSMAEMPHLWTFWRVESVPDRPLSLMAHLIGPEGTAVSVADGLGFPIEQWQPGDVIVQAHPLELPAGAPPGTYTIQTGAYWLDTMARWMAPDGASSIVVEEIVVAP